MKKYLLTILVLFSVTAVANDDFKASVTAAYGTRTSIYKGREEYGIPIFPSFSYQNLYLKGSEIGFKFFDYDRFNSSIYVDLLDGYSIKGSRMDTGYKSINRRRYQQAVGLQANFKLNEISENLTLTPSFSIGNRGSKTGLGLSYLYMPQENIIISPSVNVKYLSKKYTDYYFGVDKDEIAGSIRNEYNPDEAFEFGAGLYGEYYFTKNISALAYVNMKQYSSEVTKSPITEDRIITNVGAGLKYTF